jgi:hypothetical protein
MSNQVTKIIIRNGSDVQRRTANNTGITFSLGEPAYCTDTKRFYIGDGTPGGAPISVRNLGRTSQLFGNFQGTGFTEEAYGLLAGGGADVGDFLYDNTTRTIYSLSARSNRTTSFVPLTSDLVKYDVSTLINPTQFFYDSNSFLNLQPGGVDVTMINSNAVDGITIIKPSLGAPIQVSPGSISNGVPNTHFKFIPGNSILLNNTNGSFYPNIVTVYPGQVVGRTASSNLTACSLNQILATASFTAGLGLAINATSTTTTFDFDYSYFSPKPTNVFINKNTTVKGILSGASNASIDGSLTLGSNFVVNSSTASTNKTTGAVVVAGGLGVGGNINAGGDVVAYATSDVKLKTNIKVINSPIDKIQQISGVNFDWSEGAPFVGHDTGVLAHEIEKVLPEAVTTRENGIKAVRYEKIIPLLIEAIKELNNKINK